MLPPRHAPHQIHRLYCYIVWSATTAGLLLLEPFAMLVVGSATRGTRTRLHKKRHIFWAFMVLHLFLFPAVYFGLPVYLLWDSDPNKYKVREGGRKGGKDKVAAGRRSSSQVPWSLPVGSLPACAPRTLR